MANRKTVDINGLRTEFNKIDSEILRLISERRNLSREIIQAKDASGNPLRDTKREEELLLKLIHIGRDFGIDANLVTKVYHEIIDDSLRIQQAYLQNIANFQDSSKTLNRVVYQGIEGSYSSLASRQFFARTSNEMIYHGLHSFEDVIRAVENDEADYAVLPIENTTAGVINDVYDLLLNTSLSIVGEEKLKVNHCLITPVLIPLSKITVVYSHPQAVAQCSQFLSTLKSRVEYYYDTASSVKKIKDDGDVTHAAIASEEAARQFGLVVLKKDIGNQPENYTRFIVAAAKSIKVDTRIPCKTSLVMATAQKPGALVDALLVFKDSGINLTKLESRPILGKPWEEMFYLDFEGNIDETRVKEALDKLSCTTRFLKILGSYPSTDLPPTEPPIGS